MTSPEMLAPPAEGDDWLGLSTSPLPVHDASEWAVRADCGAIVTFTGAARDHSDGRPDVDLLEYEAYETQVEPRLARIAAEARARWAGLGRLVMLHRVGSLAVGDAAVVVVASSPHRDEAFHAARFCIDTLKGTVPIWKKERWADGSSWGLEAQHVTEPEHVGGLG
ncbi:MAG: molybdenum cofactor biosynthesis protein MoaE [Acidimicrobiales bacterium]|nr:molybdenum cofactor biosynthesis protein MoaE [Acidimicrobiales bacterium]